MSLNILNLLPSSCPFSSSHSTTPKLTDCTLILISPVHADGESKIDTILRIFDLDFRESRLLSFFFRVSPSLHT